MAGKDLVKRAFLRACINHGCLNLEKIENILAPLCSHHNVAKPKGMEELKAFVSEIESTIKEFSQALVFIKHAISGEEYLVFAFRDATPDIHPHPAMSPEECQYFSILLDKLALHDDCHMLWNEAYANLDFKGTAKPPKKARMQELVRQWCLMGYFLEQEEDIYLGPRSLVEFDFYLRSNYPETIKECKLCKNLVFWDIKCSDCETKIHRECIRKYLRTRSNCPTCGEKWSTRLSI